MILIENTDFKYLFSSNFKNNYKYFLTNFTNLDEKDYWEKYEEFDVSDKLFEENKYDEELNLYYIYNGYINGRIEIIEYNELFIPEIIRFNAIIKINEYYFKIKVYDYISPNKSKSKSNNSYVNNRHYSMAIDCFYSKFYEKCLL